jgi:hypothetical protein
MFEPQLVLDGLVVPVEDSSRSSTGAVTMKGNDAGTERARARLKFVDERIGLPLTSASVEVTYADIVKNKYLPKVQGKQSTIKHDILSRAHSLERIQ